MRTIYNKLLDFILELGLKYVEHTSVDGIKISNFRNDPHFEQIVIQALRLIERVDIKQYETIKQEIKWIIHTKRKIQYVHNSKILGINFLEFLDMQDELYIHIAGAIVHTATYGKLMSKKSKLNDQKKYQFCIRQEDKFYEKAVGTDLIRVE